MGGFTISVGLGHGTFRPGKLIGAVKCRLPMPIIQVLPLFPFTIVTCEIQKIAILAARDYVTLKSKGTSDDGQLSCNRSFPYMRLSSQLK